MAFRLSNLSSTALGYLMFVGSQLLARATDVGADDLIQLQASVASGQPVICVGWHSQVAAALAVIPRLLGRRSVAIMVLANYKGRVLSAYAKRLRMPALAIGDSPIERLQSVARLTELVRADHLAFLAADGPKGPAFQAKDAIVLVAQRAGARLLPCALVCDRHLTLAWRWDRHVVPLPGARLRLHTGRAIDPGRPGDAAATARARIELQQALVGVNKDAREFLSRRPDSQPDVRY
ncbi:MAG TPA: hypothetical protein VMW62_19095 [Chloroflexota bacterium]|nr:hypothetical protein [Chloroflexota bacterium]